MSCPLTVVTVNEFEQKLLLCSKHEQCLTLSTCDKHLQKEHKALSGDRKAWYDDWVSQGVLSNWDNYRVPEIEVPAIIGLQVESGFECNVCKYAGIKLGTMNKHFSSAHKDSDIDPRFREVKVQKLGPGTRGTKYFPVSATHNSPAPDGDSTPSKVDPVQQRRLDWEAANTPVRPDGVQPFLHVSENTPWLTRTGYPGWMMSQDEYKLAKWASPRIKEHGPIARRVGEIAVRLFRRGLAELGGGEGPRLHSAVARVLNSLDDKQTNSDPIKTPQNESTKTKYADVLRGLMMFYIDAVFDSDHRPPFATGTQAEAELLHQLCDVAEQSVSVARATDWEGAEEDAKLEEIETPLEDVEKSDGEEEDAKDTSSLTPIEQTTMKLCMLLICRRSLNAFDSPLLAYAATQARDFRKPRWKDIRTHTSWISALLFSCQMVILVDAVEANREDPSVEVIGKVEDTMTKYVVSSSTGPLSELASIRAYGMVIARRETGSAQVWWNEEGTVIRYKNLELSMDQIRKIIADSLEKAAAIFHRRLCFGLDLPELDVKKIKDNWSDKGHGASILTNAANADVLEPAMRFMLEHLDTTPSVQDGLLDDDHSVSRVKYDEYIRQVRSFLEHMMVAVHMGSGQPARRPEFQGIRWQNKESSQRNLLLHDGQMLFVVQYHKSQSLTNGSRWPARFLPGVATRLMVRYITIVVPLLQYMTFHLTSERISPYLWTKDFKGPPIGEDVLTRVLTREAQISVGVEGFNIAAWRQIAVGIAIRHMGADNNNVVHMLMADGDGGVDSEIMLDHERGMGVPDVVHWQGSHNPMTANSIYGGTVDYQGGLTDEGLRMFKWASVKWHLLMNLGKIVTDQELSLLEMPPPAKPRVPRRSKRCWTEDELEQAFNLVYGEDAVFRPGQKNAMLTLANATQHILVVLRTGGGKSALYQVPTQLTGAGTTVLIVPLVGLKLDTIKRCSALGIRHRVWNSNAVPPVDTPLVLISIEEAVSPEGQFMLWAREMIDDDRLDRIVFDEAHLLATASSYRPTMARFAMLRQLQVPIVFLSATMPTGVWNLVKTEYKLDDVFAVRHSTDRPELEYRVEIISWDVDHEIGILVKEDLEKVKKHPDWRSIVIVRTKEHAESFAHRFKCVVFHSSIGNMETKRRVLHNWKAGESPILVATRESLTGLDSPCVRHVIFAGSPDSCLGFAQDAGRAGRDGKHAAVDVVVPSDHKRGSYKNRLVSQMPHDMRKMWEFLYTRGCRRQVLTSYLDGPALAETCKERVGSLCDNCMEASCFKRDIADAEQLDMMQEDAPRASNAQVNNAPAEVDHTKDRKSAGPGTPSPPAPKTPQSSVSRTTDGSHSSRISTVTGDSHGSHASRGIKRARSDLGHTPATSVATSASNADSPMWTTAKKYHAEQSECGSSLKDYETRLEKLAGVCMLCWLGGDEWQRHGLDDCPLVAERRDYMLSRQRLKSFLLKYTCCFKCGAAQEMCQGYRNRRELCKFNELILPMTWRVRTHPGWRQIVEGLGAGEHQETEDGFGRWLAQRRLVKGQWQSNNMNELARQMVERMTPA